MENAFTGDTGNTQMILLILGSVRQGSDESRPSKVMYVTNIIFTDTKKITDYNWQCILLSRWNNDLSVWYDEDIPLLQ